MNEDLENNNQELEVTENQEPPKKKRGDLKRRVITGVVLAAIYTAVVLITILITNRFTRFVYDAFVMLVAVFATLEICNALSKKHSKPITIIPLVFLALGFGLYYIMHFVVQPRIGFREATSITAFFIVLVAMVVVALIVAAASKKHTMNNALSTILVMLYPGVLCMFMLSINYIGNNPATAGLANFEFGVSNIGILLVFLVPAFADTFAFIFGSLFKGPKLAPKISPKKTISGAIGGIVGGIAAASIVLLFSHFGVMNVGRLAARNWLNILLFLILGAVAAVFTIAGDLIASVLKRKAEIKDFGKILPGHGGIMDRLDGAIVAAVFIFAFIYITTLVGA